MAEGAPRVPIYHLRKNHHVYCAYCGGTCTKKGLQKNGTQKLRCKSCNKYQQQTYRNKAWLPHINRDIARFLRESVCIRGIGRLAEISVQTVISRIKKMAQSIKEPPLYKGKTYEVDELRTYVRHKGRLAWVVLAYERETKRIVRFSVGARTNETLKTVLDSLILANPKKIYTDGLDNYRHLIGRAIHRTTRYGTKQLVSYFDYAQYDTNVAVAPHAAHKAQATFPQKYLFQQKCFHTVVLRKGGAMGIKHIFLSALPKHLLSLVTTINTTKHY